ncbi:Nucleotide-binding oligomerization domain-containing protein 2, partial [Hondaea fermentalgiana]
MPCDTTIIMHSLAGNGIGDSGAVGLGKCLGKNRSLTLAVNGIGDSGAVMLGKCLGKNSSL